MEKASGSIAKKTMASIYMMRPWGSRWSWTGLAICLPERLLSSKCNRLMCCLPSPIWLVFIPTALSREGALLVSWRAKPRHRVTHTARFLHQSFITDGASCDRCAKTNGNTSRRPKASCTTWRKIRVKRAILHRSGRTKSGCCANSSESFWQWSNAPKTKRQSRWMLKGSNSSPHLVTWAPWIRDRCWMQLQISIRKQRSTITGSFTKWSLKRLPGSTRVNIKQDWMNFKESKSALRTVSFCTGTWDCARRSSVRWQRRRKNTRMRSGWIRFLDALIRISP